MSGDLARIRDALARPTAYPHAVTPPIVCHETHISVVFLAGDRAYKIKKPVRLPILDYTTLAQRRRFCELEVALNRRLAPDVYRGVVPITADLRIGGTGAPIEYAVAMNRLPSDRMLDVLLAADSVDAADIDRIAARVARFHAETRRVVVAREHVLHVVRETLTAAEGVAPDSWRAALVNAQERHADELRELLDRRADGARDGHGDLHAGNICLPDGHVVIYDCIEFDEGRRCGDPAAEIAFLSMDLRHAGRVDLADRFVARYVELATDSELPRLLPFFETHRACVRGVVASLRADAADSASYFRLAVALAHAPWLLITCGMPGSGKSYAAQAIARATGAAWLRSDTVRKELYGMAPHERWRGGYDEGLYAAAHTDRTYAELAARARALLDAGRAVVVDATFDRRARRDAFRALHPRCLLLHLDPPEDVVRARLEARERDPARVSDAGRRVRRLKRAEFEPPSRVDLRYDTSTSMDTLLDQLTDALAGP